MDVDPLCICGTTHAQTDTQRNGGSTFWVRPGVWVQAADIAPGKFRFYQLTHACRDMTLEQLQQEQLPDPAEGCVLLLSEAMITVAQRLVNAGGNLRTNKETMIADCTYTVTMDKWAVAGLGIGNKHTERSNDLPHSQFVPISFGWVPKEDLNSWAAFLNTSLEIYREKGIHFDVQAVLLDGTAGGAAAVRCLLPGVPVIRDLRHVLQNVRELKLAICKERKWADYLAAEITFSASLCSDVLFHVLWDAILADLVVIGHFALEEYVRQELLVQKAGRWSAHWRSGWASNAIPGHGPHTEGQCLERFWRSVKTGLPKGYHRAGLRRATDFFESSIYLKRQWISKEDRCAKRMCGHGRAVGLIHASKETAPTPASSLQRLYCRPPGLVYCRCRTCPHEILARWLEADPAIYLRPVSAAVARDQGTGAEEQRFRAQVLARPGALSLACQRNRRGTP